MLDNKGHTGWRFVTCGFGKSNLQQRRQCPRAAQTLFSRYRMGSVDSCGSYPRHLGYLPKGSPCRFCSVAKETPFHLLRTCPGTANFRFLFGLSPRILFHDTSSNLLNIALFDDFLTMVHPVERNRYQQKITQALVPFLRRKRKREPSGSDSRNLSSQLLDEPAEKCPYGSRRRTRRLIIPQPDLP